MRILRRFTITLAVLCGPLAVLLMGQSQPGLFLPNTFLAGATSATGTPTAALGIVRTLIGLDLPLPATGSLGGVAGFTPVSHEWINGIGGDGTPSATQPAIGDLANVAADIYLGNNTGSSAAPKAVAWVNCTGLGSALTYSTGSHTLGCNVNAVPQVTVYTTGSGTFTSPVGVFLLEVEMCGPGGGGAGSGTGAPGTGATSSATTFGSSLLTCNAGSGATPTTPNPAGGTCTGGDINFTGQTGGENYLSASSVLAFPGFPGGNSAFVSGAGRGAPGAAGTNATANSGSGGGGGGGTATAGVSAQPGGAGGGCLRKLITSPLSAYAYAVGGTANGGGAGTNGFKGGDGAAGYIRVIARFQ